MGDKSPKSKQHDQKQKDAAKAHSAAVAKSKQESQSQAPKFMGNDNRGRVRVVDDVSIRYTRGCARLDGQIRSP